MKAADRREITSHRREARPWGGFQCLNEGELHQVKHIHVKPGGKLSLQRHRFRSEHWVVVSGRAKVTVCQETRELQTNQSVYIPRGAVHRLINEGEQTLHLIEVQCGSYLGEDDIERLEDCYGRSTPVSFFAEAAAQPHEKVPV
jgi:mannose-6-phosphate isomerase-like protein (cupin superfamily)